MNVIAANLKRLREAKGLSQQALGKAAGLKSNAHVSHIESGTISDPGLRTLQSLAEALECDVTELFMPSSEADGDSAA